MGFGKLELINEPALPLITFLTTVLILSIVRLLWPYLNPQRAQLWNRCSQWGTFISRSFPYCSSFLLYMDFSFQYAGIKTTQRNGWYQVWWTNVLPNRLLVVGRHMGAGLGKIKLLVIFLRKSHSRHSLQILFFCSVLHLGDSCRRCATLGGVTSVIQLENSGPCSVPASILPLHRLRLYWRFYHIRDHCQSVSGAGFMEGVTTRYLTMQYETGLNIPSCKSYAGKLQSSPRVPWPPLPGLPGQPRVLEWNVFCVI